ncbi:MAG: response regulator [Alphaproteobacteria bacterium]
MNSTEKQPFKDLSTLFVIDAAHQPLVSSVDLRRGLLEKPSALVVDDDDVALQIAAKTLENDCDIFTASNAQDALVMFVRQAPDVVFLDIRLPDASGLDLLAKLLEIDPRGYVVMLSGNSNQENILNSLERGAKGFVGKPFQTGKLIQYVGKCPSIIEKKRKIS